MYIYDIIEKKRNGLELTKNEIDYVVSAFVDKKIEDSQMSSLLMAIVVNGMTYKETLNLTLSMRDSSDVIKFDDFVVDKHSTGGVSDSTTLLIVPIVASLGIKIGKMSGRSLGFTGGTIDKIEVFEGYNPDIPMKKFIDLLQKNNCSIISQTANVAYADKLIYTLRNKTATVDSVPLIASSIMSKKLASGCKLLILNVTFGSGAFMKEKKDAVKLAKIMVKIGNDSGVKTIAVVSDMNTPLSYGIGASLEVESVLKAYDGENSDLLQLSKFISSLIYSEVNNVSISEAEKIVNDVLKNGIAKEKLTELIQAQGGSAEIINDHSLIKKSKYKINIVSNKKGYLTQIDALAMAKTTNHIQVLTDDDKLKKYVGVELKVKINDYVRQGDVLAVLHLENKKNIDKIKTDFYGGITISKFKTKKVKIVDKLIR